LLDDRDELDERCFEKEKEGSQSRSELEATEVDEDMIDEDEDGEDDEEDEDGDAEDEGKDENKNEDDLEGGEEGDEEVPAATPFEAYVDDEVKKALRVQPIELALLDRERCSGPCRTINFSHKVMLRLIDNDNCSLLLLVLNPY
jgi:hypothetical protein